MLIAAFISVLLIFMIAMGFEIFLALGVAGALGILLSKGANMLVLATTSFYGQLDVFEMIALPLFILMGHVLSKTPIGKDLFQAASNWLSWLPGLRLPV